MASFRTLQPLAHQLPRAAQRTAARRFLNTDTAPVLTTAHAQVTGGRAHGKIKSDTLNIELGVPKSMGGKGDKANPEELFAAGYGACFQSAMNVAAAKFGLKMPEKAEESVIETDVHLVGDAKAADFGLKVDMLVKVKGMSKEELEKVVEQAKKVCPYSRATQGNISTTIKVETL